MPEQVGRLVLGRASEPEGVGRHVEVEDAGVVGRRALLLHAALPRPLEELDAALRLVASAVDDGERLGRQVAEIEAAPEAARHGGEERSGRDARPPAHALTARTDTPSKRPSSGSQRKAPTPTTSGVVPASPVTESTRWWASGNGNRAWLANSWSSSEK